MAKKNVRVELTKADLARRGVITLLVGALMLALLFLYNGGTFGGPNTLQAQLTNAGGSLANGADVKMRGLIIGSVSGVDTSADGVRVHLALNDGQLKQIPDNTVARILPATVFGTSFVDLTTNGAASGRALTDGAVVPADATQGTLELQKALDDIDALVKVLDPAKLNSTLTAAASALDGRGAELGSMVDGLNTFLTKLNPDLPLLQTDLSKLAVSVDVIAKAAPTLLDGVNDALPTLRTIAAEQGSLATLLTGGRTIADQANALLTQIRPDLIPFVQNAATITTTYSDNRQAAFSQSFTLLRALAPALASVVAQPFAKTTVALLTGTVSHYTSAQCPRYGSARGDNCGPLARAAFGQLGGAQ